jgi:4-hydroxybenzoate polyprenyltransferase
MLANRYVDRRIDAANPRTAGRALPAGRLSPRFVAGAIAACGLAFIAGAAGFWVAYENPWPLALSPVVLAWLFGYALTKRFTWLCHFILGAALAISPLAAGLAIEPQSLGRPTLWLLAAFVLLWVGGFDIIYAIADIDIDRRQGLHSIPAKFGRRRALLVAKAAHLLALLALVIIYRVEPLLHNYALLPRRADQNPIGPFVIATLIVALLLIAEHRAASRGRFSMAFFTLNGVIALALGAAGIAEILLVR